MVGQKISAEEWYNKFCEEYELQKIADWWERVRKGPETAWTYRMAELLRNLALKMGYELDYEIGTDFSWHKGESMTPKVAIELENKLDASEILRGEIPNLFASDAPLKVLITYCDIETKKELEKKNKLIQEFRVKHSKEAGGRFLFIFVEWNPKDKKWNSITRQIF